MAYWLRSGKVGAAEIKDEVRQQSGSPGRKWTRISSSQVKEIERNKAAQKAKAYYEPGGGVGKGVEAGLERERTQAMSSGMQSLVASGFAGTTMAAGLGKKFSEEVGMPTRARIEETRGRAISDIEMMLANMAQQSGQTSAQMGFQGIQAQKDRDLQKYLANLQVSNRAGPTMTMAPTQTRTQPQRAFTGGGLPSMTGAGAATYGISGGYDDMPTMAPFGGNVYGSQEAFEQNIPGQHTPSAMDEYLKTYVPKSGDFSTFSWGA